MKVGSLVYATEQGLGRLAKSFYDAGVVTDVLVISHGTHKTQPWYLDRHSPIITDLRSPAQNAIIRDFIKSMDVMLFFETPFRWELLNTCRKVNTKSFLMTMYECTPEKLPALPDVFLCPSRLDYEVFEAKRLIGKHSSPVVLVEVPVDVPWRQRTKAEVFVHNAGNGSFRDRNGTKAILEAWPHVESDARLILRTQTTKMLEKGIPPAPQRRIDLRVGTVPYEQLWNEGDVFLFPERFNGLSLPLQEARAAGMLVMAGDRFPINTWLPSGPLIPVSGYKTEQIGPPYMSFNEAQYDPEAIAAMIDSWYGSNITHHSLAGKAWAEGMSWEVLKPQYMKVLKG